MFRKADRPCSCEPQKPAAVDSGKLAVGETLSRVYLDLEGHKPTIIILMSYSANLLVRHLTIPTFAPMPALWESIIYAILAVLPVLFLFILIAITPPQDDTFLQRLGKMDYALNIMMVVGAILGWIAGAELVPQHAN